MADKRSLILDAQNLNAFVNYCLRNSIHAILANQIRVFGRSYRRRCDVRTRKSQSLSQADRLRTMRSRGCDKNLYVYGLLDLSQTG